MNGAQDLGGMMGFGDVNPEKDEPCFHADWEKRALALTLAMGAAGEWNIDMSRHARETLNPAAYLSKSYYEIWIEGLAKLLEACGLASADEIARGAMSLTPKKIRRVLKGEEVADALSRGSPCDREAHMPARFKIGDAARTITEHKQGHTRLPRYARGKRGVIERTHGVFVFPDAHAHGIGEQPQWLYTVRFSGAELWGRGADAALGVSIDAWESYLEPA